MAQNCYCGGGVGLLFVAFCSILETGHKDELLLHFLQLYQGSEGGGGVEGG